MAVPAVVIRRLLEPQDDLKPGKPWSIFQLKTNFTMNMIQKQFQHSIRFEMNKSLKAAFRKQLTLTRCF
jgi:hypothetical protein